MKLERHQIRMTSDGLNMIASLGGLHMQKVCYIF